MRGQSWIEHPHLGLAFRGRQLAHGGGEALVLHDRADALRFEQVPRMVRGDQIEGAEHPGHERARPYKSNSASHFAAQMKSFSDSPPMACVQYATRHLL